MKAEMCSRWSNFSLSAAPPPPPPPSVPTPQCEAYATNAVAQAQAGQGCGFKGGRWDTRKAPHLQWCMSLGGNQALPDAETAARDKELRNCAIKNPYYQQNVNMPGQDYRSFETTKGADAECSTACSGDAPKCKAWTWARRGTPQGGAKGRCYLKTAAPNGVFDQCCISGLYKGVLKAEKAAPAPQSPAPTQQTPAPQQANSTCGPAGGKAVVVIPEPNLDKLNVRASPGGRVLTMIPEGAVVTVMGACGADGAAGFRAPSQSAEGDWCRIGAPVSGCVMARYLQLGGSGGGAGFSRQKTRR